MIGNGASTGGYAARVTKGAGGRAREYAEFDRMPRALRDRLNELRVPPVAAAIAPYLDAHGLARTLSAIDEMERAGMAALAFADQQLEQERPLAAAFATGLKIAARRR